MLNPPLGKPVYTSAPDAERGLRGHIRNIIETLQPGLNGPVQWGYLEKSTADGIKNFKPQPGHVRFLTDKEYESLLSACDDGLRDGIITVVNTGLCSGELFLLDIRDIDFAWKLPAVRKAKTW